MLPGLPRLATDRDQLVVSSPRREVVEIRTDDERVLHILEPVTVPGGGGGGNGGGIVAYAETSALTLPVGPAGLTGAWTLTPEAWRVTLPASVGDILEWAPSIVLGGGPAALDLVCLNGSAITRALSSGTTTPAQYGSMYSQGDAGTVRLPVQRWLVRTGEPVSGQVTLALAYRAAGGSEEGLTLGAVTVSSRVSVLNHGPVGGGGATPAVITIPASAGGRLFMGEGTPASQSAGSAVATQSVVTDFYLDRAYPALWTRGVSGWEQLLDLRPDTILQLGMGGPPAANPGNYHRVRELAIDVGTLEFYELGGGGP